MSEVETILALKKVKAIFTKMESDYNVRIKTTVDMFSRIESVFRENKILDNILDNMDIFHVTSDHISYQVDSGNYKFVVDLRYGSPKVPSYFTITIKNVVSKKILQQQFHVYLTEVSLPKPLILIFRNAFPQFYRGN